MSLTKLASWTIVAGLLIGCGPSILAGPPVDEPVTIVLEPRIGGRGTDVEAQAQLEKECPYRDRKCVFWDYHSNYGAGSDKVQELSPGVSVFQHQWHGASTCWTRSDIRRRIRALKYEIFARQNNGTLKLKTSGTLSRVVFTKYSSPYQLVADVRFPAKNTVDELEWKVRQTDHTCFKPEVFSNATGSLEVSKELIGNDVEIQIFDAQDNPIQIYYEDWSQVVNILFEVYP